MQRDKKIGYLILFGLLAFMISNILSMYNNAVMHEVALRMMKSLAGDEQSELVNSIVEIPLIVVTSFHAFLDVVIIAAIYRRIKHDA